MAQDPSASYNTGRDLAIIKKDGINNGFVYHPRHIPQTPLIRDIDGNLTWKGFVLGGIAALTFMTLLGYGATHGWFDSPDKEAPKYKEVKADKDKYVPGEKIKLSASWEDNKELKNASIHTKTKDNCTGWEIFSKELSGKQGSIEIEKTVSKSCEGKNISYFSDAFDKVGNYNKTPEKSISVKDITPPKAVKNFTAEAGTDHIKYKWENPDDEDFDHSEVYADGLLKGKLEKGVNEFNLTGLEPGSEHNLSVKTVDKAGNTNESSLKAMSLEAESTPVACNNEKLTLGYKDFHTQDAVEIYDPLVSGKVVIHGSMTEGVMVPSGCKILDVGIKVFGQNWGEGLHGPPGSKAEISVDDQAKDENIDNTMPHHHGSFYKYESGETFHNSFSVENKSSVILKIAMVGNAMMDFEKAYLAFS